MKAPMFGAAAALLAAACGPDEGREGKSPPPPASRAAAEAPSYTSTARLQVVPVWREIAATVRSLEHIQASAETAGRLLKVHADVGDHVRAGQLLAEIDASALEASLTVAVAAVELAQAEADRVRRLRDEKIAPEQEWDRAQTRLRQAQAQLAIAEIQLARAQVLAPVDAVVEARVVGPGDLAVPGTPLFQLYDPLQVCLEAQVPVGDRDFAGLGATLSWSLGHREGASAVSEVAPSSDSRSRTVRIRVPLAGLEGPGDRPAPGDFGTLRYRVGERQQVVVPAAAVFRVGQVEMVLVKADRGWVRRAVRTGAVRQAEVEVLSGLAGGEEIGLP
ncbi:MAG: efflux RND transporter periplasmic adaptor subunit [Planctomycetes bacterium]|nr:efflux RND transporter periplasmic adaptor subunit [Planctomycetota bacterium]